MEHSTRHRKQKSVFSRIVILALVVLVVGGIVWGTVRIASSFGSDTYHAVFLSNGQVYFGTLSKRRGAYMTLRDVYYFGRDDQTGIQRADLALVRLGSELHGPTEAMEVNRDHILFIEELRADSRVVNAIREYTPR